MSINKYSWTEEKIEKFYKEGRGTGELNHYIPWIKTHEVPSRGRVHRPIGWKTRRIHHVLSDLELSYFYYLEWSQKVIDIREQFPLERESTMKIALDKGIKHPIDNRTQTNIVMTTDFLITTRTDNEIIYLARAIKPSSELEDPRVLEKLELERQYWEDNNVEWCLIDEKVMSKQFVKNLHYVHEYYKLKDKKEEEKSMHFLEFIANEQRLNPYKELVECCNEFDSLYNLEYGSGIYYLRHLYANKYVLAKNMEISIQPFEINLTEIIINKGGTNRIYDNYIG